MSRDDTALPATYFAPAARATDEALQRAILLASRNPVVDGLMRMVPGLLAVLNEQRQILALNDTLLAVLGVEDAGEVLGLRPGEALNCIHAHEHPGGCGTSPYCATCGAVIAIVACLTNDRAETRDCVATVEQRGERVDLYFRVQCSPIRLNGERLLLLFLQDNTAEQKRAALERVFFHDVNNIIDALAINTELLECNEGHPMAPKLVSRIARTVEQLAKEVEIQKTLCYEPHAYQVAFSRVPVATILEEVSATFGSHPAAQGRRLVMAGSVPDVSLSTDRSLLQRVLGNMLLNALEATAEGGEVRFWIDQEDDALVFNVWNQAAIPEDVGRRVFQRNFSTKGGAGRGLGTYSMKLFTEAYLQGRVDFTTSPGDGTVFRVRLPQQRDEPRQKAVI